MADWNRRFPLVDGGRRSARADRDGGVLMKAFIQLTNNRSCLLRADEIKADYERGHITVSDGGRIQGVFDMGVLEYVYMTEPRKEQE